MNKAIVEAGVKADVKSDVRPASDTVVKKGDQ